MHFKPIYQYKYAYTPDDLNSVYTLGSILYWLIAIWMIS